jgi:hypothetical protein
MRFGAASYYPVSTIEVLQACRDVATTISAYHKVDPDHIEPGRCIVLVPLGPDGCTRSTSPRD